VRTVFGRKDFPGDDPEDERDIDYHVHLTGWTNPRRSSRSLSYGPDHGEVDLHLFPRESPSALRAIWRDLRKIGDTDGVYFAVWRRTRNASASSAISRLGWPRQSDARLLGSGRLELFLPE